VLEVYNFYKIAKTSFVKHKKGDIAEDFGFVHVHDIFEADF